MCCTCKRYCKWLKSFYPLTVSAHALQATGGRRQQAKAPHNAQQASAVETARGVLLVGDLDLDKFQSGAQYAKARQQEGKHIVDTVNVSYVDLAQYQSP